MGFVYIDILEKKEYNGPIFLRKTEEFSMKKFTALLLAALIVISMAACAKEPAPSTQPTETEPTTLPQTEPTTEPTTEPPTEPVVVLPEHFDPVLCAPLVGTWTTQVVLDGSLMNMLDMEESVSYTVTYSFSRYGAYRITSDEVEVAAALDSYKVLLQAHMVESLYSKFYAESRLQGMSKAKIEELWEESKKAEVEQTAADFVSRVNLESRIKPVKRVGDYYVEEGLLYISMSSGGYETSGFSMADGSLTLTETNNPLFYNPLGIRFPLELTMATE